MKQDIDPNAPGYDPAISFAIHWQHRIKKYPIAVVNSNVVAFELAYRGNGKLQAEHYERLMA